MSRSPWRAGHEPPWFDEKHPHPLVVVAIVFVTLALLCLSTKMQTPIGPAP